jgi:putative flippase GtrA
MAGLLSAAIDYLVFILSYQATQSIFIGQLCARLVSTGVNFLLVRQAVFLSKKQVHNTLPKYLSLVVVMGFISYLMIQAGVQVLGLGLLIAKMSSELILYFVNFIIQRDYIFTDVRDAGEPQADVIQYPQGRKERQIRKAA